MLTVARSLGEFGALTVVAGGVAGESQTLTLLVHARYIDDHNVFGAYAASTVLMGLALITLVLMTPAAEETRMITVEPRDEALRRLSSPSTTSRSRCPTAR